MENPGKSPVWLHIFFVLALAGTIACFIGAIVTARTHPWTNHSPPPLLYVRWISTAVIGFGLTFALALTHTIYVGGFYSGITRRNITRDQDALQFWLLLAICGSVSAAIVAFGIFKFISV